jgi:hypothetical protein
LSDAAPAASAVPSSTPGLQALRGLRSAPSLDGAAREFLRQELLQAMEPCAWFTIGVMAPSTAAALAALRLWEGSLGWSPLQPQPLGFEPVDDHDSAGADPDGTVFLKGNQRTGSYLVRPERGLGEGVLISGHHPDNPAVEDTWGPLPLNLFAQADA